MKHTLAAEISQQIRRSKNDALAIYKDAESKLSYLAKNYLPSGSGVDGGCEIHPQSHANNIGIVFSFHHMDEHGGYDGWTAHKAIVTPDFSGIDVRITGPNRNGIKEYLGDLFHHALSEEFAGYGDK